MNFGHSESPKREISGSTVLITNLMRFGSSKNLKAYLCSELNPLTTGIENE